MTITNPGLRPGPRDNQAVLWRFVGTGRPDSLFAMRDKRIVTSREGVQTRFLAPFHGGAYAFFQDDGSVAVGHGEDSALSVLDERGREVRRVELDPSPRPLR